MSKVFELLFDHSFTSRAFTSRDLVLIAGARNGHDADHDNVALISTSILPMLEKGGVQTIAAVSNVHISWSNRYPVIYQLVTSVQYSVV